MLGLIKKIPLYLIFSKVNGYFEEINKRKYITLVCTNESKEKVKKYEKMQSKIRDLIRSITKKSEDYDKKYMKIKFRLDDELPLNKTKEIPSMIIAVGAVFLENKKYYPQLSQMYVCIKYTQGNKNIYNKC